MLKLERKKEELTKKGPESEFDEDKEEDKPENDDYDEEEYAEEGGEAAERGGGRPSRERATTGIVPCHFGTRSSAV